MATPSEKFATSLEVLHALQADGKVAIRSADLSRTHRERLLQNGFLQEVIKGWYVPSRPDEAAGGSTAWYAAFWPYMVAYLNHLKGDGWCLSPEESLSLHAENWSVPRQLLVRAIKARNNVTALPHETSLLEVRAALPDEKDLVIKEGVRLFSLPTALIGCGPRYFVQEPTDARAALAIIRDASEVLEPLLEGGHSKIAGRLAGGFRNIGRDRIADDIIKTMQSAGYTIREQDPFEMPPVSLPERAESPYVNRLRIMWQNMREDVILHFPDAPGLPVNAHAYLKKVEEIYVTDAYHSLSIEGYQVSPELIERVRSGNWNPDQIEADREHRNALAARGYWQAYQVVIESIKQVLKAENAGNVFDDDHRDWYREMFAPSVAAGILKPADLAGYRNDQVYIRGSFHVPPNHQAVRDAVPALIELLREETVAAVRVVLGHFIFVYIHPYMDGNGRLGRFLMNLMLASGGYSWTVVPLDVRDRYMAALEAASVRQDIVPFTELLAELITRSHGASEQR